MALTKVFVGNLSFKTREADLASEFSSAGKVVTANIITRGPRSLGYGFVEFETEEEAQKAVQLLNRKVIDTREINVEVAKPRDESRVGQERRPPPRRRGRGGPADAPEAGGAPAQAPAGTGEPRAQRGRGRRFRPRNQGEGGQPARRGRGGGVGRGGRQNNNNNNNAAVTPSNTTLFVANLPFALDDQGLADLFKDLQISKAHVVKNRNGRSKGFGFVEFENEERQKAALTQGENFEVEGRKLIVKIALTENRNREENANQAAPASGANQSAPASEKKESTS